jgi:hypothetical protein
MAVAVHRVGWSVHAQGEVGLVVHYRVVCPKRSTAAERVDAAFFPGMVLVHLSNKLLAQFRK